MDDTWKKQTSRGLIIYTTSGEVGIGFVHTAKLEGRDVATVFSHKTTRQPTRTEVEELFVEEFPR